MRKRCQLINVDVDVDVVYELRILFGNQHRRQQPHFRISSHSINSRTSAVAAHMTRYY